MLMCWCCVGCLMRWCSICMVFGIDVVLGFSCVVCLDVV